MQFQASGFDRSFLPSCKTPLASARLPYSWGKQPETKNLVLYTLETKPLRAGVLYRAPAGEGFTSATDLNSERTPREPESLGSHTAPDPKF